MYCPGRLALTLLPCPIKLPVLLAHVAFRKEHPFDAQEKITADLQVEGGQSHHA